MKMKKNQMHNILESINRGIRIALDDYDYNELKVLFHINPMSFKVMIL